MDGQDKVLSMWAYLAIDADGTEGVVAAIADGIAMPLVGADLARVTSMEPVAQRVADQTGSTITLAHFSVRTDGKVLRPRRRR